MNTHAIKLQEEKTLLESELSSMGSVDIQTGQWDAVPQQQDIPEADENDKADRAEGFEERTATVTTLNARLDDINHALAKIEGGSYGTCELCANPIESDRLEANPAARTCKGCMEKV